MPTEVKGALELRKALRQFTPNLAKETQKELGSILRPITNKAKGFIPAQPPLSGWAKEGNGSWARLKWSSGEAKRGIGFKATPSKPNRAGFRSLARIVNASPSGAIFETAGRKSGLDGRPQAPLAKVVAPRHPNYGKTIRSGTKNQSLSNNPEAGKQFIAAINKEGEIVNAYRRAEGQSGRSSRKMRGRAIFRAWAEDGGKTNAAVIKAIETSKLKFENYTLKAK